MSNIENTNWETEFEKLGFIRQEMNSSVFRDEPKTIVFQTDHRNHTKDCSTILYSDAVKIFDLFRSLESRTRVSAINEVKEMIEEEREICSKVLLKATYQENKDIYEEKVETCDDILGKLTRLIEETK